MDFEECEELEDKRVSDFVVVVVTVCVGQIEDMVEIFSTFDDTFVEGDFDSGIDAEATVVNGEGGFLKRGGGGKLECDFLLLLPLLLTFFFKF